MYVCDFFVLNIFGYCLSVVSGVSFFYVIIINIVNSLSVVGSFYNDIDNIFSYFF